MSERAVTDAASKVRRPRMLSPLREHLRDTFWFAPTAAMVLVFLVWLLAAGLDDLIVEGLRDGGDVDTVKDLMGFADDARTVVSTVSSAMMTFIGVVFSISLVAVQMAGGQFSPRVVRLFVRSRITKATFAVFLATFLLSLLVLTSYDGEKDPELITSVPFVQAFLTLGMVGLSVLLFVLYVNSTLRMMRVSQVIDRITGEAFRVVERMPYADGSGRQGSGDERAVVAYDGPAGVLRDVNIARLVRVARGHGVVLWLIPRIGDFVVPGTPVFAVHGGAAPSRRALRSCMSVAAERTFHQDLGFGLRVLADIALRALSAAVNDPTTAVQAIDRIVQFLAAIGRRPLDVLRYPDRDGVVRLVQPVPGWEELVDLGFTEIRGCAVHSPQVTRRVFAGLDDLLALVPAERREPLLRHRELLAQAVERSVPDAADRAFALRPDRQGIG
ncbi:DUF2254 domain-containing protein [Streptomyces sp. VRA16 Mangrove soil]|uniref:DUF2254 domain-containing protein n=1 Tax=Streptomyces sp. VRA16 Mangrove soil TaxID=2817434 RepID=UPI001A9E6460|nr:DUF2254 domain-containing protein [Streptomyces sp. VRA16 Mangrove soil]MBO1330980.1 DUF2254 domain-containing protein [Streptomyces sp. VRA16 Mangrove soil]